MAVHGIVSLLYDSSTKTSVGPPGSPWLADLASLSPAPHHLLIRTRVIADSGHNTIDIAALKTDLQAYKDSGFSVYLVFDRGSDIYDQLLNPVHQHINAPNAPLGGPEVGGDKLLNTYINHFSMRVVTVVQQLEGLIAGVFLWNESNLSGSSLQSGGIPGKPSSLAPENFGALLYSTVKRLRATCPWLLTIYPGALSCLVGFDTDVRGPWIGGYMSAAIAYLRSVGAVEPWQWDGVALNMEGAITEAYLRYTTGAINDLKGHWGLNGPLVLGEWGTPSGGLNPTVMAAAFKAVDTHCDVAFFFSHHSLIPGNLTTYGCTDYSEQGGVFTPTTPMAWHSLFKSQLATLYSPAQG